MTTTAQARAVTPGQHINLAGAGWCRVLAAVTTDHKTCITWASLHGHTHQSIFQADAQVEMRKEPQA